MKSQRKQSVTVTPREAVDTKGSESDREINPFKIITISLRNYAHL
ncbi:hypothetical protein [Paenibacillus sp. UMB4589-SE434]|nr:hypothetical protein [Paenibacillus sp. UMB4589-SE434]MDK8180055.1 hypothetical protein [Paenibacillus sp. UMB4589-SE434]